MRSQIAFSPPEEWHVKSSVTLLAPNGEVNVIASEEPLSSQSDSTTYAATQGEMLRKEFPGFEEQYFEPEPNAFGAGAGFIRQFSWLPPDGEPVMQIQMYFARGGRGYTATATSTKSSFGRWEGVLVTCLRSLHIDERQ